jgi:hypothetical protein
MRYTQQQKVLDLLKSKKGEWVALPEILALGIAQYNARIFDLRRRGHIILNKTEPDINGVKHSWFKLVGTMDPDVVEECGYGRIGGACNE